MNKEAVKDIVVGLVLIQAQAFEDVSEELISRAENMPTHISIYPIYVGLGRMADAFTKSLRRQADALDRSYQELKQEDESPNRQ